MKKSNETIGNRTRDLPACSAVPQPTAPPRAPISKDKNIYFYMTAYNLVRESEFNLLLATCLIAYVYEL